MPHETKDRSKAAMRFVLVLLMLTAALLQGCGKGGAPDGEMTTAIPLSRGPATMPPGPNMVPVTVSAGLGRYTNGAFVSARFCVPGHTDDAHCATVDHLLVDTGSVGMRVYASALPAALLDRLEPVTGAINDLMVDRSSPIALCTAFSSDYMLGGVRWADVQLGQYTASSIPVHVMDDPALARQAVNCPAAAPPPGQTASLSAQVLQANGVLGIGTRERDQLGPGPPEGYYYCPTPGTCLPADVPLEKRLAHPVAMFPTDNNGTVLTLPTISPLGASAVSGYLIFGIGTQANNRLPPNATVLPTTEEGDITTVYNGALYGSFGESRSLIDSGSNAYFFPAGQAPVAGGKSQWYLPSDDMNVTATMVGLDGAHKEITFTVLNARTLFLTGYAAFATLGRRSDDAFHWGLPFFFGRSVYTAIAGRDADGRPGPYVAF